MSEKNLLRLSAETSPQWRKINQVERRRSRIRLAHLAEIDKCCTFTAAKHRSPHYRQPRSSYNLWSAGILALFCILNNEIAWTPTPSLSTIHSLSKRKTNGLASTALSSNTQHRTFTAHDYVTRLCADELLLMYKGDMF